MSFEPIPATPLRNLLAAYLNQDWQDEYPDVWAAVTDFAENSPRPFVDEAHRELSAILISGYGEAELESLLDRYGCDYYPPGEGYTYEAWLRELELRLRPTTSAPPSVNGHGVTPGS